MKYLAILQRKNGQEIKFNTNRIEQVIYYPVVEEIKHSVEEIIEMTPNNIIVRGGFSDTFPSFKDNRQMEFRLYNGSFSEHELIYKEV